MRQIKAFGKSVLVLMEGDGFGYCQMKSNENNSVYAAISDTEIPELKVCRAEYFFGDHGLGLCHFKKYAESGVYALFFGRGERTQANYLNDVYFDGNLFIKSRVKKNYYHFGGISLNRTSV